MIPRLLRVSAKIARAQMTIEQRKAQTPHRRLILRQAAPKGLKRAAAWVLTKVTRKVLKKAEPLAAPRPRHSLSVQSRLSRLPLRGSRLSR